MISIRLRELFTKCTRKLFGNRIEGFIFLVFSFIYFPELFLFIKGIRYITSQQQGTQQLSVRNLSSMQMMRTKDQRSWYLAGLLIKQGLNITNYRYSPTVVIGALIGKRP